MVLSLFLLSGCSKKQLFDRAEAEERKAEDVDLNLLKKDRNDNIYYHKGRLTFRFETQNDSLSIKSRLSGKLHINMTCLSPKKGELAVSTAPSNTDSDPQSQTVIPLKKGYNDINFQLNVPKGQEIILQNPGGRDVVFSKPLIYKSIPVEERTNIFLISVDTLSSLHMSLYGYERETTPNLEKFAEDSVVFLNAFSNSSWTVTSHMSLFTSLHEHEHKVDQRAVYEIKNQKLKRVKPRAIIPLSYDIPFFPEDISREFATVSYNGGLKVDARFGFYRGFDLYYSNDDLYTQKASAVMFEEVRNKLREAEFPNAFYFLHTYHVHAPHNPQMKFLNKIPRETEIKEFDFNTDLGGNKCIFKETSDEFREDIKALYDAEILSFDHYFGEFIRFLKENKFYENSMIILVSDHGEEFFEHQRWAHGSDLYNEQTRIPLLIKFPGQEFQGKKIKENVTPQDILPTLMDYYGIKHSKNIRGQSLLPLIKTGKSLDRPIVSSIYKFKPFELLPGKIAVIQGKYKMIFNKDYTQKTYKYFEYPPPNIDSTLELYDLEKDPGERNNLFSKNIEQKEELFDYLRKIKEEMDNAQRRTGRQEKIPKEMLEKLKALGYIAK
ncbi:sulfatase-like hydrolase/transferase [bacterium]|nr:sulfatase-like hydrolase/transferase [bacterium]